MKKIIKKNQYKIIGLIALAVIAITATLISYQGENFQGKLTLKPAADVVKPVGDIKPVGDLKPMSGEPGPYSGEPVATGTAINKAELAKLVVATLHVDTTAYKACAPDVVGTWYETYACYMVSRGLMNLVNDGNFHPEQMLTCAEGAKVFTKSFIRASDWYAGTQVVFKDVPANQWYYVYVMTLAQKKILDVDPILPVKQTPLSKISKGLFSPSNYLTRKAATIWAQNISANLLP